jgi:excisionase family DNA binding protein
MSDPQNAAVNVAAVRAQTVEAVAALLARKTFTPHEAAACHGVSRDFFDEHIRNDLRVIRKGRKVLIPVSEIDNWIERFATPTFPQPTTRRRT